MYAEHLLATQGNDLNAKYRRELHWIAMVERRLAGLRHEIGLKS